MSLVSIIIPVLNEEKVLQPTLVRVREQEGVGEIIVVDGGSSDASVEIASTSGVKVLAMSESNRASQMNRGAAAASGGIFLFLHADTLLPKEGITLIRQTLACPQYAGGAFARKFASDSALLKITCLLAEVRNRVIGWHLGDQAIFCRREVFEELGGFKLIGRFEDLDFSRRMRRIGAVATVRPPVISSARRFEKEGPGRRTWKDFKLTVGYIREQRKTSSTPEMLLER